LDTITLNNPVTRRLTNGTSADQLIFTAAEKRSQACAPALTATRSLVLASVVVLALLLLLIPPLAAALSVVGNTALDHVFTRLEAVSRFAFLAQVGRLPLSLALATWLARSSREH
jgi:hypothetical protein